MDIEYKGGNCVVINCRKNLFVTDPKLSDLGLKDQGGDANTILLTQARFASNSRSESLVVDGPGEYEVSNCSIKGIAARRYSAEEGNLEATIYRLDSDDISLAVLGHVHPQLSDSQLEEIGVVDVLVVPVGNHGYTLDPKEVVDLIRAIEPKIVIPTHFAEPGVNYEVPQLELDSFLGEISAEHVNLSKLKLKPGQLPAQLTVYHLERSK